MTLILIKTEMAQGCFAKSRRIVMEKGLLWGDLNYSSRLQEVKVKKMGKWSKAVLYTSPSPLSHFCSESVLSRLECDGIS